MNSPKTHWRQGRFRSSHFRSTKSAIQQRSGDTSSLRSRRLELLGDHRMIGDSGASAYHVLRSSSLRSRHTDVGPAELSRAKTTFSILHRQCLDRRIDSLGEVARQVEAWEALDLHDCHGFCSDFHLGHFRQVQSSRNSAVASGIQISRNKPQLTSVSIIPVPRVIARSSFWQRLFFARLAVFLSFSRHSVTIQFVSSHETFSSSLTLVDAVINGAAWMSIVHTPLRFVSVLSGRPRTCRESRSPNPVALRFYLDFRFK